MFVKNTKIKEINITIKYNENLYESEDLLNFVKIIEKAKQIDKIRLTLSEEFIQENPLNL